MEDNKQSNTFEMKKISIFIIILVCFLNVRSQENNIDMLLQLITNSIINNAELSDKIEKEFVKLDSTKQSLLLGYLNNYSSDSILYLNIDKMRELISSLYYKSAFNGLRQRATILLLDTYRLSQYSFEAPICWYPYANQNDFNIEAKNKIIKILQGEPFSKIELDVLYKIELNLQEKSFCGDTLRIRQYKKKSLKKNNQLQDSLANSVAISNMKSLNPGKSIDLGVSMLASWLDMNEAISYIESEMKTWDNKNPEMYNNYKIPLARLGNKKYESELLDNMILTQKIDLHVAGFICSKKTIDVILTGLKLNGKPKQKGYGINSKGELVSFDIESSNYNCTYLSDLVFKKLINNFPFKYDIISLTTCEISEIDILKVVEWIEKNRNKIELNRDYH